MSENARNYYQEYYLKNKAKIKERANSYYSKNKKKVKAKTTLYKNKSRLSLARKSKEYKKRNKTEASRRAFLIVRFRKIKGRYGIIVEGGIRFKTPFLDFMKIGQANSDYTMNDLKAWREICRNSFKKGFKTYLA